jgi:hypothetical protein
MDDHNNLEPPRPRPRDMSAWAALLTAVLTAVATLIDAVRAWW